LFDHLQSRRRAGAGAATTKNDLIWLRVVFRYAKRVWGVPLDIDLIDEVADTAEESGIVARPRRRVRRPSAEELRRLTAWFRARRGRYPMDLIMWLAIYSARRQDELCRLKRGDFNLQARTYWVRDLKHPDGSQGRDKLAVLPDPGWAVYEAVLARVPAPEDGRLLPFDAKTVGAYFTRACKMRGIRDLRFHDLRHEACSRLAEDGRTIPEIQAVSLHDSWSSLQRYVQVTRQDRVEWADL
jgi:integrase